MATIRQHGNRWQVRVRRKGFPEIVKSFHLRSDAERWGRQIETEIDRGAFIPRKVADRTTVAELIERYKQEVTPHHRGSAVESIRLGKMATDRLGKYSLSAISPMCIAEYRDARLTEVTSGTVLRELQILSAVFNHARKEWQIPMENPVSAIRRPAPNRARSRRLEPSEEARLLAALEPNERDSGGRFKGMRNTWIKPLVILALETAIRRGELLNLTWADINLQRRVAYLRLTKNGDSREVPLSAKALALLASLPHSIDGRIFPVTPNALKLAFVRAVARSGLGDFHFHDLRHEATSRLANKLPNLIELASVTGHKDLRMLARYYHPKADELARKIY